MAMIGDGTAHYDHDFDGTSQEAGGCHVEFRNRQTPSIARVRYVLGTLWVSHKSGFAPCRHVERILFNSLVYLI